MKEKMLLIKYKKNCFVSTFKILSNAKDTLISFQIISNKCKIIYNHNCFINTTYVFVCNFDILNLEFCLTTVAPSIINNNNFESKMQLNSDHTTEIKYVLE